MKERISMVCANSSYFQSSIGSHMKARFLHRETGKYKVKKKLTPSGKYSKTSFFRKDVPPWLGKMLTALASHVSLHLCQLSSSLCSSQEKLVNP